jgi:FkbM family methyltransferase
MSSRILIDGGANSREWLERYLPRLGNFERIYAFEPNPAWHASYEGSNITLIKKAIWTQDCWLPLYLSKDPRQSNSSLYHDKICKSDQGRLTTEWGDGPIQVECLDFSRWLQENIQPADSVTLKLDIEGAEYDVLWKLLNEGTIRLIHTLHVEFHTDTLPSKKDQYEPLVAALRQAGIEPLNWD